MKNLWKLAVILVIIAACSRRVTVPGSEPEKTVEKTSPEPATPGYGDENPADDYYGKEQFRPEDRIYRDNIRTVQLYREGWALSPPVIELQGDEKLRLSFDDLDADLKNYRYTIIHCSALWQVSGLMTSDYIDGFTENQVVSYKYSFNTIQRYTHYNITFPDKDFAIKISGNYIIKIFMDNDPDKPVLTRRFMVVEPKVTVKMIVKRATLVNDRNYKQEIDFTINHPGYEISNPYGDITAVITQNDRWDNAITKLKPLFVRNDELIYDYEEGNVFLSGNEFRRFDTKNLRYRSERVNKISYEPLAPGDLSRTDDQGFFSTMLGQKKNHVYLNNDQLRSYKMYSYEKDINGKYFIKNDNGNDSESDADYAFVHFTLPYEAPFIDGNLYVFGELTRWNFTDEAKMKYNYEKFAYETTLYLKQGYYNYEYAFLKDGKNAADNTLIEGSHYDTENLYTLYIYHHSFGSKYDKLIAIERSASYR